MKQVISKKSKHLNSQNVILFVCILIILQVNTQARTQNPTEQKQELSMIDDDDCTGAVCNLTPTEERECNRQKKINANQRQSVDYKYLSKMRCRI